MKTHQKQRTQATPEQDSGPVICPYCGSVQLDQDHCDACTGLFEPLSRQATQNQMGPWFLRDAQQPFRPGCNYLTLKRLVERGIITNTTILKGPTTHQFWTPATRTPGVAHLLGICHNCAEQVEPDDYSCTSCGAIFTVPQDRQHLGLGSIRLLPGSAPADVIADSARLEPEDANEQDDPGTPSQQPVLPNVENNIVLPPKEPLSPEETETLSRQITRDDDVPTLTKAANRRLRQTQARMRWLISGLVVFNIIILLALAIAINPRLGFNLGGQESSQPDNSESVVE